MQLFNVPPLTAYNMYARRLPTGLSTEGYMSTFKQSIITQTRISKMDGQVFEKRKKTGHKVYTCFDSGNFIESSGAFYITKFPYTQRAET